MAAWEFSPEPVCTLSQGGDPQVRVTFDGTLYEIRLVRQSGWPAAPVFALRFEGAAPLTITTTRHRIEGTTLSVTDRGFGNVLNGLQFNTQAVALIGDVAAPIDLTDATDPVAAFRKCPVVPTV